MAALDFTDGFRQQYEVLSPLGEGGMGVVYKCVQRSLDRAVAVKFLSRQLLDDEFLARFRHEAKLAGQVFHSNLVAVIETGQMGELPYIVFEFVDGASLRAILTQARGALPLARALDLVRQAADGLACAHRHGIIHRDIKPENLLVRPDDVVKVADFGVAKETSPRGGMKTRTGYILGTPAYMSPEQAQERPLTSSSDIYSLGVVLYEMLAGAVPFSGGSTLEVLQQHVARPPPPLPAAVPQSIAGVVARLMAKEIGERPADMAEVSAELSRLAGLAAPGHPGAGGAGAPSGRAAHVLSPTVASGPTPRQTGAPAGDPGATLHGLAQTPADTPCVVPAPDASAAATAPDAPHAPDGGDARQATVRRRWSTRSVVALAVLVAALAYGLGRKRPASSAIGFAPAPGPAVATSTAPSGAPPANPGSGAAVATSSRWISGKTSPDPEVRRAVAKLCEPDSPDPERRPPRIEGLGPLRRAIRRGGLPTLFERKAREARGVPPQDVMEYVCRSLGGSGGVFVSVDPVKPLCAAWEELARHDPTRASRKLMAYLRHAGRDAARAGGLAYMANLLLEDLMLQVAHRWGQGNPDIAACITREIGDGPVAHALQATIALCDRKLKDAARMYHECLTSPVLGRNGAIPEPNGLHVLGSVAFIADLPAGWKENASGVAALQEHMAGLRRYVRENPNAFLGRVAIQMHVNGAKALGHRDAEAMELLGRLPAPHQSVPPVIDSLVQRALRRLRRRDPRETGAGGVEPDGDD
jgi:serine/threonine protein kinase